jgi:hypothetical protein
MIHLADSQRSRNTAPFLSKVGGDRSTHVYGTASALALRAFTGAANYLTILQGSQLSMVQHHVGSRTVPLQCACWCLNPAIGFIKSISPITVGAAYLTAVDLGGSRVCCTTVLRVVCASFTDQHLDGCHAARDPALRPWENFPLSVVYRTPPARRWSWSPRRGVWTVWCLGMQAIRLSLGTPGRFIAGWRLA